MCQKRYALARADMARPCVPSRAYEDGGIHEAIADYEDAVFFDILAEELARRDMISDGLDDTDTEALALRMDEYMSEFEKNGIANLRLDT